ncbi:MAG: tetratricopeptide repeat protein, partial [Actinobacteria bacterium]|nr:tetratricopeptide repeat protein [Actinomycetota bacterium]
AARGPHAGRPGGSPAVVPRQLPATSPYFTGRSSQLAALAGQVTQGGETPLVAAVTGMAGVGKTAFAVRFAQQEAARFPDGQLYVNLRGFDPADTPVSPGEALTGFLTALNVSPERIPAGLDAQAALYRSLLAGRRMLILLDNARNAQQVRQLLPGSPGCLVLVTSRSLLASLAASDGARLIELDVLTEQEAGEFLSRRLGRRETAADAAVLADLAGLCARLPLALAIAAAQVAARPGLPVETLTRQLRDASSRLDALNAGEETSDVRSVFSWSYRQLSAPAARMFRLLGLHPGPDVSVPAAASLAGDTGARATLDELARAHLLTEHLPGRFASHDLLRAYAASCARADEDPAARTEALGRVLDHYLHTAHAGALLFNPGQEPLALTAPRPGVFPETLITHKQAQEWFTAEQAVLLAAIPCAAETGFGRHAWQLAWTGETFFGGRGRWDDHATALRAALAAAQQLRDPVGQAHMHRRLGFACGHLGSYQEAHTHYREALIRSRNNPAVTAEAHVGLAWLYGRQNQARRSLSHATQALDLYQALGNQSGMARALNNAGWCYAELGDDDSAINCSERSVAIQSRLGDDFGAAAALDTAGFAHHRKGRYLVAVDCYRQAIAKLREVGYGYELGVVLSRLGDAWRAAGDPAAARSAWQEALEVFDHLRHPDAERARAKLAAVPADETETAR